MKKDTLSQKLFLILLVLGLVNITFAYSFFYFSSISLLEERGSQQMDSVRAFASEKLKLYFIHLKDLAHESTDEPKAFDDDGDLKEALSSTYETDPAGVWRKVSGDDEVTQHFLNSLKPFRFSPFGLDRIALDIPFKGKHNVFLFNLDGVNRILGERAGLGMTGEVYLVGKDQIIRSASRHMKSPNIKVPFDAVEMGIKNKHGIHIIKDYRKVDVLSAYSPFDLDDIDLVLLSEIDQSEVIKPLSSLLPRIFVLCAAFLFVSLFLAWFAGRKILAIVGEMKSKITALHLKLINAAEEEKREISINLHDGVGQMITAIKWGLSQNEQPEKLKDLCDKAMKDIRIVSNNLMPSELSEMGPFAAIKNDFRRNQEFFKIEMSFWYSEALEEMKFKEGVDVNIYRMVQELVQNSLKHSQATMITLVMFREHDKFILRYEDNGIGMSEDAAMPRVLQYRAELIGAAVQRSGWPRGLVYKFEVPMENLFYVGVQSISAG